MQYSLLPLGKKKGAGTLRRIFNVESFECLKHQSARTDKKSYYNRMLQQQSDINDQLNSICRFVSGIPIKKEIKSKSESRKYYNMNGNLEKEIIEFNVNFKTRANNSYQMKIKWCEYSPKKPDDKGICFLSVRYLGKTEKNLQGKVRTYAEIK